LSSNRGEGLNEVEQIDKAMWEISPRADKSAMGAINRPLRVGTLEEDEDEDDVPVGSSTVMVTHRNTPADLSYQNAKYSEYQAKYGTPDGGNGSASGSWNPARVSAQQHMWLKRGLTFAAAFMAASLSYMFFAHFPSSAQAPPLLPSQGSIAVLLSMIPLATLGALVADRDSTHRKSNALNRFYVGLVITLSTLGLGELVWHMLLGVSAPPLQLCTMLLLTAVGATIGTNSTVSELLIEQVSRAMKYVRPLVIAAAMFMGGSLGFMLTMGTAFSWLSPFAILLGIGVMLALVMRVDHLVKHPSGTQSPRRG